MEGEQAQGLGVVDRKRIISMVSGAVGDEGNGEVDSEDAREAFQEQ
jgi:hypothetical protein